MSAIHTLHSLPETDAFNALGIPESIDETLSVIEPWIAENQKGEVKNYTWAIELKEGQVFTGLIALKLGNKKYKSAEVWFKLNSAHWNQGYGTEALQTLLRFGFDELELHRIHAGCAVENQASIRLLEKVGMSREGRKRQVLPLKTGWSDNFEYAILASDKRLFKDN